LLIHQEKERKKEEHCEENSAYSPSMNRSTVGCAG